MTLYAYLSDYTGCGSYRIKYPYDAIKADSRTSHLRINLINPGEDAGLKAKVFSGKVLGVTVPVDCDSVLIQRPTSEALVGCIPHLQELGIRVLVDIDDDLLALHPSHPTQGYLNSLPGHSVKALRSACQQADTTICSTPALAEKYASRNGRTVVVRNSIPRSALIADISDNLVPHIGWPGAISTHPEDLKVLGDALMGIDVPFIITGPEPEDNIDGNRARSLARRDVDFTGEIEYEDWQFAVSKIHTGIAPLTLTPFNQAKSALKPLELAAAGVPFVKSPTDEYELLGAGLTADGNKPRAWKRELKRLLADDDLRSSEIERNYDIVYQNIYDLNHIVNNWVDAWGLIK